MRKHMRKRITSLLLVLALCLTLLPTAALADPASGEEKQENQPAEQEEQQEAPAVKQDEAVATVQAMIDALPDAEALDGMDDEALDAVYEAFQAACDAYYDTLTEEQQAQLKNTEKLAALSERFSQPETLAEGEHQHPICGARCADGENHGNVNWTGVSNLTEITTEGNYYLTKDVTLSDIWQCEANVNLCLNGKKIIGSENQPCIKVDQGYALTLCDCVGGAEGCITHNKDQKGCGVTVPGGAFTMYGGTITGNTTSADSTGGGGGVHVFKQGSFEMKGGSITNNQATNTYGGGVCVSNGTFKMTGGTITGNNAYDFGGGVCMQGNTEFTMENGTITGNHADKNGGGVYVDDQGGTFTMNSGNITQNTVDGMGGGVYMGTYTTFTMETGTITGNTAAASGGGVSVSFGGTFNMKDGTISGNHAKTYGGGVYMQGNTKYTMEKGSIIGNNADKNGGGVYISGGIFNMSSGSIGGNTTYRNGGGVYVSGGSFNMYGGGITGNEATSGSNNGGGVYVAGTNSKFTVSGEVTVIGNTANSAENNVYLCEGKSIAIGADGLQSKAKIGVTCKTLDSGETFTVATGAMQDLSFYKTIFTPDVSNKGYKIIKDNDNLCLTDHQHSWKYAASGATITATCDAADCTNKDGGSVTISAPGNLVYNGQAKAATVTASDDWKGLAADQIAITYKKDDKTLDSAPTNAGNYTASIELGGVTASVEYTITKATPKILSWQGYPYGKTFDGTRLANPASGRLTITGGTYSDIAAFNWYAATKNKDGSYTKGGKLNENPIDAGDYIIEAVFKESNNVYAATDALGLTIGKAQHANNGDSIAVPLNVYPASGEYVYEVDIAKALENIPHGGGLEPNTTYNGISTNLVFVNLTRWDKGKLYVTMKSLAGITGTTLGSITVNLTSKNYTVVPVVVNITLQPKQEVSDISVSMDNWTYGGTANAPVYTVPAGVTATVTYAAQGSNDFSENVPTDAGNYTVKVQYETATEIHTGTAEFTIAPKTLTKSDLHHTGPITKTYDGSDSAPTGLTVSVKSGSLVSGDTLAVSGTLKYNSANVNEADRIIFTPTAITTGNYALAATEVLTINGANITKANQAELTVTSNAATYGADLTLTVSGGNSNGAVTYTVTNGTGSATINGSKLHPTKAGTVTVTATKAGDNNYKEVTSDAKEITIAKARYGDKDIPVSAKIGSIKTVDLTKWIVPGGSLNWLAKHDDSFLVESASLNDSTFSVTVRNSEGVVRKIALASYTVSSDNYADYVLTITITATAKDKQTGFKFENSSVTKIYGDADFTLAATGAATGSTVTYESSNQNVATVDANGKVTIKGAGTAAITAKASATKDYEQATATYTLTVGKKSITIKAKDQTAYVGDKAPVLGEDSYTVSGLVGEDTLTTKPTVKYVDAHRNEITPDMTKTGKVNILASGAAASGNYTIRYEGGTLTISTRSSGGGGDSFSPNQKPTIQGSEGAKTALSADGTKLTITVEDGYEITDVLVNGVSKGAAAEITGLKTGDKVEVKTAKKTEPTEPTKPTNPSADKKAKLVKGVRNTRIVLKSKLTKDGKILLTWTKSKGYKVDKFEIYRSVKKNSGYGKKAIFTTKGGSRSLYLNTKNLKAGRTYYYKVRGVRIIDGKKYYTKYSSKTWRRVK